MKEVIEVLNQVNPGIDYEKETSLITDEILTSFDIVTLVSLLNKKFDIEITIADMSPEKFESAETIYELVQSLE